MQRVRKPKQITVQQRKILDPKIPRIVIKLGLKYLLSISLVFIFVKVIYFRTNGI